MNQVTKGKAKSGSVACKKLTVNGVPIEQVGNAFGAVNFDRGVKVAIKAIAGADLHTGVLNWPNPEASAIVITRIVLDATTKSTGASTTDIGTTATSATTASDNLIDGVDTGTATIVADNFDNKGTNGKALQKLAVGKWVTIKEASGDATGLVANLYIYYTVI